MQTDFYYNVNDNNRKTWIGVELNYSTAAQWNNGNS